MQSDYRPKSAFGRFVNEFEEYAIAGILWLMTAITFVNVVVRYVFNSQLSRWFEGLTGWILPKSLIWGLEATSFLFAWLVLFGIGYCFKVTAHLGVDALLNVVSHPVRRALGLLSVVVVVCYCILLLKGSWDYWANFVNLPQTTGRWFPTGFEEMSRTSYRSWYEVNDIPMLESLRFLEGWVNDGEHYEKLPRFIPYAILPLSAALMLYRVLQAGGRIISGEQESLIVSHEVEDAVREVAPAKGD